MSLKLSSRAGMITSVSSGLKVIHMLSKLQHLGRRSRPHLRRNGEHKELKQRLLEVKRANIWTLRQINLMLKNSRKDFQRASTLQRSNFISPQSSLKPPSERPLNLSTRRKHGSKKILKKLKVYSEKNVTIHSIQYLPISNKQINIFTI